MTKTCRKCGTAFSDNLSTCPVCKTALIDRDPTTEVNGVTASYAALKDQLELVTLKSRYLVSALFFLVGFTGAGFFYLQKARLGWWTLLTSFSALTLAWLLSPQIGFFTSLGFFLLQTLASFYFLFYPDAKDGRGELLK
jgi:TM2 domain-containing membrane protein YozV